MNSCDQIPLRIHFAGHIPGKRLIPLAQVCGMPSDRELSPARYLTAYDELAACADEMWRRVDVDEADIVVFPHPYHDASETADAIAKEAAHRGLPCAFCQPGDKSTPANPPHGLVFRTSIFADKRTPREHAMAAHTDDMLEGIGEVSIREKRERPSVGFCGNVGHRGLELGYAIIGKSENVTGTRLRRRVMRALSKSKVVETKFIPRDKWWGGALTRNHHDPDAQRRLREDYVQNMLGTDYMLCVRGAGNFSFRFYEALSAGRIPLLIDTACVLPFDDEIRWEEHCLIVDQKDYSRTGELLAEYHGRFSAREFVEMQKANRALWESKLKPVAFYQAALQKAIRSCEVGEW